MANKLGQDTSQMLDLVDRLTVAHEQSLGAGKPRHRGRYQQHRPFTDPAHDRGCRHRHLRLDAPEPRPARSARFAHRLHPAGGRGQPGPAGAGAVQRRAGSPGHVVQSNGGPAQGISGPRLDRTAPAQRDDSRHAGFLSRPCLCFESRGEVEFRNPAADQLAIKLLFSGVTRLPEKVDEKVEHVRSTGQDYLPTLFKDALKFHLSGSIVFFAPDRPVTRR